MEDLIKLVKLSIINGKISEEKYAVILKRAENIGVSEEELKIIIDGHLIEKSTAEKIIPNSNELKSNSFLPYIIAVVAIISTFLNWVKAYSNTSYLGQSSKYDMSFSGWWGGYGVTVAIIFIVGCYLYYKRNKFWWVAGILAFLDGLYIYSALTNANASVDFGQYGSSEAGYKLQIGFYLFCVASILFSLVGLFKFGKTSGESKVKKNIVKGGWNLLVSTLLAFILSYLFFLYFVEDNEVFLVVSVCIGAEFVLLIPFLIFSKSFSRAIWIWSILLFVIYAFLLIIDLPISETLFLVFYPLITLIIYYIYSLLMSDKSLEKTST